MSGQSTEEFKRAFKTITKPRRPSSIPGSDKDALEKAVDSATTAQGVDDREAAQGQVLGLASEIQKKDAQYLIDLIAYKYVKHVDEGSNKKPLWVDAMPQDAFGKALEIVVPKDASDGLTRAVLEKALISQGGKESTARLIFDRNPDAFVQAVLDKWQEHDQAGQNDLRDAWANATPSDQDAQTLLLSKALEEGNAEMLRGLSKNIASLRVPDDFKAIATANPSLFIKEILPTLKAKNDFVKLLADPDLRAQLKVSGPKEWAALVDDTPMLKLLDTVEKKKLKDQKKISEAIFDAVVTNEGLPLGYRTVSEDTNRVILSGGTEDDKKARAKKKEILGDTFPDIPSTQCHSLLELTETLMHAYPGAKPKITQGTCDHMALTKPLSAIPGKGLLDKSFGGNVFDDDGNSLNQVLFTGDAGTNSHTWIVVDGVAYDPVMGTRGKEVKAAVAEEFKWDITDRVATLSGKRYIVKEEPPTIKPNGNQMGFGTAYRMTRDPAKYLNDAELAKLGVKPSAPEKGKGKSGAKVRENT